jgi:hypothetical protein
MALQGYWMLPIWLIASNTTTNGFVSTPAGGIGANQGVRAYCIQTSYEEAEDQGSSFGEIWSYVQNGITHTGPFGGGVALGPGVTEVTAHFQSTDAWVKYLLMVDIFN